MKIPLMGEYPREISTNSSQSFSDPQKQNGISLLRGIFSAAGKTDASGKK